MRLGQMRWDEMGNINAPEEYSLLQFKAYDETWAKLVIWLKVDH